jgi:hypothetical protein
MIRSVLYCHPGKVGKLVEKFRAINAVMEEMGLGAFRMYTDVSGERFWTLVLQSEHESLDVYESFQAKVMADARAQAAMAGYHDLVVEGRREMYKVEG